MGETGARQVFEVIHDGIFVGYGMMFKAEQYMDVSKLVEKPRRIGDVVE